VVVPIVSIGEILIGVDSIEESIEAADEITIGDDVTMVVGSCATEVIILVLNTVAVVVISSEAVRTIVEVSTGVGLAKITENSVVGVTIVFKTEVDMDAIISRVGATLVEEVTVSSEAVVVIDNIEGVIEVCEIVEDVVTTGIVVIEKLEFKTGAEVGIVVVGVSGVKMIVREAGDSAVTVLVGEVDKDVVIV